MDEALSTGLTALPERPYYSVMGVESSITEYYARRANEYERVYAKPERQSDLQRLREFVERAFVGDHVLELACGTGYWTEIVARHASSVIATDINEEVLAVARCKEIEPLRVTFRQANAYSLPAFPQKLTAGLAAFWWSHVPRKRLNSFLSGFHQIFPRGARIVFFDNLYVDGSSTPISRNDNFGNTYQERRLEDGSVHEVLKNFPSETALRRSLEGIAMDVRVELLRYYWILSYVL